MRLAEANPARFADGIGGIMNPNLSQSKPKAIKDREPQVTARLSQLLENARTGRLLPGEFVDPHAGFLPGRAKTIQDQFVKLGLPPDMFRVERTERRDERIFKYELASRGDRPYHYTVALGPDGRVSGFQLREE